MATARLELIEALRQTATNLRNGAYYAWGHHGGCNCGNLLQVVTKLSKEEILQYAHSGIGEWTEIAEEYCSVTHVPLGLMMTKLMELGLTPTDIHNIEYLEDREVLNALPGGFRWLKRNQREDVILYLDTFANVLEDRLLAQVSIETLLEQADQRPAHRELTSPISI
ncbi:hypothetical protein [Flavihumibacter sp. UBA7668]|uniref:hypothetical protein n=1 Tax=Flavihumibacter sp. UBA7668 TaxID=1946542 RepID=UPI0025C37DA3|nr:hypothetical protein [Flavihumibacter sp. UBA7668]